MLHKFLNLKKYLEISGTFERDIFRNQGFGYNVLITITYKNEFVSRFRLKCDKLVLMIKNDHQNQFNKVDHQNQQDDFWMMIGCLPTKDVKKIESSYRKMCMVYHPDHGGNTEIFSKLTRCKEKALEFANK